MKRVSDILWAGATAFLGVALGVVILLLLRVNR